MSNTALKTRIRAMILKRLRRIEPDERDRSSRYLRERLLALEEYRAAKRVALYISKPTEPDMTPIILEALEAGKKVAAPRIVGADMEFRYIESISGLIENQRYKILEPAPESATATIDELDLIVTPALAFSRSGDRLGRGGGYYDRALREYKGLTVGLAYRAQIFENLPRDPWDVPVTELIYPERRSRGDRSG